MNDRKMRMLAVLLAAVSLLIMSRIHYKQSISASTTHCIDEAPGDISVNDILQTFESAAVDLDADVYYTKQFLNNHTEFYQADSVPMIKFIGVFYDDMDLAKVKYRVYHVLDSEGNVSAFFYADISQNLITHVGTGESMYLKLLRTALSSLSKSAEDVRPQLTGIAEVVFVRESGSDFYLAASISSPNLQETGLKSLDDIRSLNIASNTAHDDYVSAQQALEKTLPSDNPAADVIRDLSPAEP